MIIAILNFFRLLFLAIIFLIIYPFSSQRAIYLFLKFAGPSFIKLGQALSVRPDLVGKKLADVLADFQDKLPPFSSKQVKKIIIAEYGQSYDRTFYSFDFNAIASASIAQVHKAELPDGSVVAVKILRPNIKKIVLRDIKTLRLLIKMVGIFSGFIATALNDIANLLQEVAKSELDLLQEAANASQLKEDLKDVKGFYIPEIYWKFSTTKILVLEWIDGIAFSNKEAITKAAFDKKEIAKNFVVSYFEQVYVHGFFHADMHPGNLFLMKNGDIAAVDFGIMGRIDKKTRIAVAEILIGFLNRDYKRVAQIHIDAGFVPTNTDVNNLALTIRKIGESIVGASIKEIPLARLLENLIIMTQNYKMATKPELLLLQKTVLLVEGVGMMLDENLNMWDLARPWVNDWAKENIGFDAKIRDMLLDLFDFTKRLLRNAS